MSSYRRKSSLFSLLDGRGDASQDNQHWSRRELFSNVRARGLENHEKTGWSRWMTWTISIRLFASESWSLNEEETDSIVMLWIGRINSEDCDSIWRQAGRSHGSFAEQARYTKTTIASRDILLSAWKNISRINSAVSSDSDKLRNRDERRER